MLQTKRLFIRELTAADIEEVHNLHSLPETDEFNTLGIPANIEVTEAIVYEWLEAQKQKTSYIFCLELVENRQFIGLMAISLAEPKYWKAEVWYKIYKDHWQHGYTTEALISLLHFGFSELKLHRIEAGCAVGNIASIRVLEKAGMIREGMKRKNLPVRGEWKDNYLYAILEEDFNNSSGR